VGSVWERIYDPNKLTPNLSPKKLSGVLKEVGTYREGQNLIFRELSRNGRHFVYDLSVIFTRSEGINIAEAGYNKDHIYLPQINLALLYSVNKGLPTMVRALLLPRKTDQVREKAGRGVLSLYIRRCDAEDGGREDAV